MIAHRFHRHSRDRLRENNPIRPSKRRRNISPRLGCIAPAWAMLGSGPTKRLYSGPPFTTSPERSRIRFVGKNDCRSPQLRQPSIIIQFINSSQAAESYQKYPPSLCNRPLEHMMSSCPADGLLRYGIFLCTQGISCPFHCSLVLASSNAYKGGNMRGAGTLSCGY